MSGEDTRHGGKKLRIHSSPRYINKPPVSGIPFCHSQIIMFVIAIKFSLSFTEVFCHLQLFAFG